MKKICFALFVILSFSLKAGETNLGPQAGTYAGFIRIQGAEFKIPLVMNVTYFEEAGDLKAAFFLRLLLGGFISHEYQTYFFQIDHFDPTSNVLALDGSGESSSDDLSLFDGKVSSDRKLITAKLQSLRAGAEGWMELVYIDPNETEAQQNEHIFSLMPQVSVIPPLTGTYDGNCAKRERLQIEVARGSAFNRAVVTPLNGFELMGRFTTRNVRALYPSITPSPSGRPFPYDEFIGGPQDSIISQSLSSRNGDLEYDFFKGSLLLSVGDREVCHVVSKGIICGSCSYLRSSEVESTHLIEELVQKSLPTVQRFDQHSIYDNESDITPSSMASEVTGNYLGSIYYDTLKRSRALTIRVNLSGVANTQGIVGDRYLSLAMNKHFTRPFANEDLTRIYPFHLKRSQLNSSIRGKVFHGDFDEFVQIKTWTHSHIRGTYYSKNFGRVGEFEVLREGLHNPNVYSQLQKKGCVEGVYRFQENNNKTSLSINLVPERSLPDAFFPYSIVGRLEENLFINKDNTIFPFPPLLTNPILPHGAGSAYDPFTGTVLLRIDGGIVFGKIYDDSAHLFRGNNTPFGHTQFHQRLRVYEKSLSVE